jgi:hypothetical protein
VELLGTDQKGTQLRLTNEELVLLNNALNEVCNGIAIEEWEFQTRLGASLNEARDLLQRFHALLKQNL